MAIVLAQTVHKTRVAFNGTTTAAITPTAGSLLVSVEATFSTTIAELTISDNQGNTWANANTGSGDASSHIIIRYAMNVAGAATTVTWSEAGPGSCDLEADLLEFTGIVTSGALDVAPTETAGTSTTPNIASGTLAQADEVLVAIASHTGADTTWAPDGTYTQISENEDNDVGQTYNSQYKIVASTSSDTADWTLGASRTWFATLASFKATAGGGPTLVSAADTVAVVISETPGLRVGFSRSDTLPLLLADAHAVLVALRVNDSVPLTLSELAQITAQLSANDTVAVVIAEAARIANTLTISDTVAVAITDVIQGLLILATATDTLPLTLSEALGTLAVTETVAETLGLTVTESTLLSVVLQTADLLGVGFAEAVRIAIVLPALADTLAITITEAVTFLQALTVAVADTLMITLAEATPPALAVALTVAETLAVQVQETVPTLLVFLAPTDTVAVAIQEAFSASVALAVGDTVTVTVSELTAILNRLTMVETLVIQLIEGTPTIVPTVPGGVVPLPRVLIATLVSLMPPRRLVNVTPFYTLGLVLP